MPSWQRAQILEGVQDQPGSKFCAQQTMFRGFVPLPYPFPDSLAAQLRPLSSWMEPGHYLAGP